MNKYKIKYETRGNTYLNVYYEDIFFEVDLIEAVNNLNIDVEELQRKNEFRPFEIMYKEAKRKLKILLKIKTEEKKVKKLLNNIANLKKSLK